MYETLDMGRSTNAVVGSMSFIIQNIDMQLRGSEGFIEAKD
jgi:hypothetical protein